MTRGMYAAAGAMLAGMSRNDVLASNLANANTPGFKLDRVSYGSFQRVLLPGLRNESGGSVYIHQSPTPNASVVDLRPGSMHETSDRLDLAVEGSGWLTVATTAGERYTRNGHFTRGADGTLQTAQGFPVLGQNGPIRIPNDDVTIDTAGRVMSRGQVIDRLKLVQFTDPQSVTKDGDSLYGGGAPVADSGSQIRQGWLEDSNTDTMRTMVEMIATMRGYEINQRIIQAQDQTLQNVIDVARR